MNHPNATPRRGFLARLAGLAAVATAGESLLPASLRAAPKGPDEWLTALKGKHRCLFDAPQHLDGMAQIHMLNYYTTYRTAYNEPASTVNAVGTFYGAPGGPATMPLGWNDAMWERHKVGELLKLTDPATGRPSVRNMFYRARSGDPVLRNGSFTQASIENLQKLGATFIMCNNALLAWVGFLSGNGTKGNPSEIERELRANLLPGVVVVPAMVIAIEKAQGAGVAYNKQ